MSVGDVWMTMWSYLSFCVMFTVPYIAAGLRLRTVALHDVLEGSVFFGHLAAEKQPSSTSSNSKKTNCTHTHL